MADDNEDEDSGSGSAPQAAAQSRPFSTAQAIFDGLTQRGVNPNAAYGAIGSLMGESGRSLNSGSINRGDGADGSSSLGFGQWNAGRAKNLQSTAQAMGVNWSDPQAQVAHLFNELDGKYGNGNYGHVLAGLKGAKTTADGNSIWTRQYEVPANVEAQVRLRQAHADALAQGAAQGTLDLSKVGSFASTNQNTINPRSFQANAGALSANSLTGGSGALNMGNLDFNEPAQAYNLGDRLTRAGAALASISNSGQASALSALVSRQQKNNLSPGETALKKLALMKKAKELTAPEAPTDLGATPDKLGRIMQRPDGTTFVQTIDGAKDHQEPVDNTPDDPKAPMLKVYNDGVSGAQSAQLAIDNLDRIDKELLTNPEVGGKLNGTKKWSSFMNNFAGESDDMSQWQKDMIRAKNQYVLSLQKTLGGTRSTDALRKMEMEATAPAGSDNDPVTAHQVIQAMKEQLKGGYGVSLNQARNIANGYAGSKLVGTVADPNGDSMKLDDYHTGNHKRWDSQSAELAKAYEPFKTAHDIKSGKIKPKSFTDSFTW